MVCRDALAAAHIAVCAGPVVPDAVAGSLARAVREQETRRSGKSNCTAVINGVLPSVARVRVRILFNKRNAPGRHRNGGSGQCRRIGAASDLWRLC